MATVANTSGAREGAGEREQCCPLYRRGVELVGKRWTGAILIVLMEGPLRPCQIRQRVPELSDRLLSERLRELEAEAIVERRLLPGPPVGVQYELTEKGRALEPAVRTLVTWARAWL